MSINIILGVFLLSLPSRSHNNLFTSKNTQPLDSVCLFHILLHRLAQLYLSAFLPASFCLSLRGTHTHRHGSICLNFSFPVWGVYPIPCSRAQRTSNTHAAQNEKKKKETERRTHRKHINEGKMAKVDVDGRGCVCVCVWGGENQDEHGKS